MAQPFPSNLESKERKDISPEQNQKEKSLPESKESQQLVEGVRDNVEGTTDVMTSGEISEDLSDDKKSLGDARPGSSGTTGTVFAAKKIVIPSVEIMRKQVAIEIEKEIKVLEREAKAIMMNPSKFSPFTLNSVVTKIRDLKDILSQLAYATLETMKGWWTKFVKGVTN